MLEAVLANPQKLIPYAHLLAELQADMHTRTVAKLPLQRQQLQRKIQSASGLATEAKAAILTDLDRLQEDNTLCHGDFHPENILLIVEELVIIDWVDATQGSPLVDAARTTLLLRVGELPPSASELGGKKSAEMRHLFYEAYLEHYTQMQSISQETVARWELPVAAARLSEAIGSGEKAEFLKIIEAALP